ncbi:FxsA family protein [Jannaschia sp.]|nr:FxsA family protein [Jannaschia sp.]
MWLLLFFIGVPLLEITLFIQVGGFIGLWPTLLIVVVTAMAGTYLVRRQGLAQIAEVQRSFGALSDPTRPLAHGAMILASGLLLLTPGFFTDAVGFALLVPGVRDAVMRYVRSRIEVQSFTMGQGGAPRGPAPDDSVIEGDFVEMPRREGPSGWADPKNTPRD